MCLGVIIRGFSSFVCGCRCKPVGPAVIVVFVHLQGLFFFFFPVSSDVIVKQKQNFSHGGIKNLSTCLNPRYFLIQTLQIPVYLYYLPEKRNRVTFTSPSSHKCNVTTWQSVIYWNHTTPALDLCSCSVSLTFYYYTGPSTVSTVR